MKKKDIVYYAQIIPKCRIYEVLELKVRTIKDNYFVAIEKRDKRAYLFYNKEIGSNIFLNRHEALEKVMQKENDEDESEEKYKTKALFI